MLLMFDWLSFDSIVNQGAKGILVAAIIFAVNFIRIEQKREEPRKSMMMAIFGLLGVCLIFAMVLIFKNKSENEDNYNNLVNELNELSIGQGHFAESYIMDKNGDPQNPNIKFNAIEDSVMMAKAMVKRTLREEKREFDIYDDDSKIYIKTYGGTYLGYIDQNELENKQHEKDTKIKQEDLLYASLKRGSFPVDVINYSPLKNETLAAKYMTKIIEDEGDLVDSIRTKAGKGLTQTHMLKKLDDEQFEALIKYLNSGKRELPFRFYELAQVYTVMYSRQKLLDPEVSARKRDSCYREYITWWNSPDNKFSREYYKNRKPVTYTYLEDWYCDSKENFNMICAD